METLKPYNGGKWTQARFNSFIKGALRSATKRWGPINEARKRARLSHGVYKCVGYKKRWHKVRWKDGIVVDHIIPVIGSDGFKTWDLVIERMFIETEGLQVLCSECHKNKTAYERNKK